HRNTSDLGEQRYSSIFTGQEFFVVDHRLQANGQASRKMLPAVAYLEMARAAMERAVPERPKTTALELHDTMWAQPVFLAEDNASGTKQVHIAVLAKRSDQVDYEIYTQEGEQEIVHCQGWATWSGESEPAPTRVDLEQIKRDVGQGKADPKAVYAMCARMGLGYGPALQVIAAIARGNGQALAELQLPKAVEEKAEDFVL